MNFKSIIAKYYSGAIQGKAKGQGFEKLISNFLKTFPVHGNNFAKVWLWDECPFRHNISPAGKDSRIDLVALTDEGNYWAVQCKCHERASDIDLIALDGFLAVTGKRFTDENGVDSVFAARLWISTNNWSPEAENEAKNQIIPFVRISLSDLETSPVDWELLDKGFFGQSARPPQKSPHPGPAKEVDPKEVAPKEIDSKEVDPKELGPKKAGSKKAGSKKVRSKAIDSEEVDSKEIDFKEVDPKDVGFNEVDSKEFGPKEFDFNDVDSKELAPKEIDSKEVAPKEVGSEEYDPKKSSFGKVAFMKDLRLWAPDMAKFAEAFKIRTTKVVNQPGPHNERFKKFLGEIKNAINPSVEMADAIEMLSQHLIAKPMFEALSGDLNFIENNPVAKSLEAMVDFLADQDLEKDKVILTRFSETIKDKLSGDDAPAAKRKIIAMLYDYFFKIALPTATEKLGILRTPVEIVDFINNSVAKVLQKEFGRDISDPNVHILDPFTGTGTFISRLIQSGLLGTGEKLNHKYSKELHANESIPLAYYTASVNIEDAYHAAIGETTNYEPFNGICLTDTFELTESDRKFIILNDSLKQNSNRINAQIKLPITVIIGHPPNSVAQPSAIDDEQNISYPYLDTLIDLTYSIKTNSDILKSVQNTYIKAFRWSTSRLDPKTGGVIAFVSNADWLDGDAMDRMRKRLSEEFSKIYVFNLKGNSRTAGELRKREADNVFGLGRRAPVAITIMVKHPWHKGQAEIFRHDIGDYLTKEEKLAILSEKADIYDPGLTWERIEPNEDGNWLNRRTDEFEDYFILGDKSDKNNIKTFFEPVYSMGAGTNRDIWCYNFSRDNVKTNINSLIHNYNMSLSSNKMDDFVPWTVGLKKVFKRSIQLKFSDLNFRIGLYRPFCKQVLYFDKYLIERRLFIPKLFPTKYHENIVICVSGPVAKEFSTLISNVIPDLEIIDTAQCFPRYYYEEDTTKKHTIFSDQSVSDGYTRHDAITDWVYRECETKYGPKVTKDAIFWYVYGLLHSDDYRAIFFADLKKSFPRLPLVDKPEDFWAFSRAGEELAWLHLNYEIVDPYAKVTVTGEEKGHFYVDQMSFVSNNDKSAIQFNQNITISDIPLEAYDYTVNGKPAIIWVMDRYKVKIDSASGIINDPNDWAKETNQPRYILDLLLKVIAVSMKTIEIKNNLPIL
jgi:predicted helicase